MTNFARGNVRCVIGYRSPLARTKRIEWILKAFWKINFLPLSYFSLVLILHFIVRIFSHYIKKIKDRREMILSLLLSREGWSCFLSQRDGSYCLFNVQGRRWKHQCQMVVSYNKSLVYILAWDPGLLGAHFQRWSSGLTSDPGEWSLELGWVSCTWPGKSFGMSTNSEGWWIPPS